jgi:hydroxyethylthiazole kinase
MLLSPPFLPARGNLSEDDWLAAAMPADASGEGLFPVGARFEWHGGVHLTAPAAVAGGGVQNVRAIADGTVVFVRQRTEAPSPDDPLNYGGGYTSNGTVVIRHDTEIGVDAHGAAVAVRFYSVYQHLNSIRTGIATGRPIYRKTEIGQAGHVYGQPNKFHFEICCDDANLQRMVGRAGGDLNTASDGRTDVLFGESYLHVPAGEALYPTKPLPGSTAAMTSVPPAHRGAPATTAPLQSSGNTAEPLVIGLRYANGTGAAGHQGDVTVTSYRPDGSVVGTALVEANFEYQLFDTVNKISASFPQTGRPTPAAVYEMLRFGRVVGPDALAPADVPHWRQISHSGGRGWINLNKTTIHRFTDADFPSWAGWQLADDDTDGDSRCDSAIVQAAVYGSGPTIQTPSPEHAAAALRMDAVKAKLRKVIARFPSEWDASTIDQRWNWLQTASPQNPQPLDAPNFARFKAHAQALCFALPELFTAQWCFDPREFIRHFRRSSWLSLNELTQLMPRQVGHASHSNPAMPWATALSRFQARQVDLNKVFRKYGFEGMARRTHFLAQTYIETAMWRTMREIGQAHSQTRNGVAYWPAPAMEFYQAFFGRGAMQLTWAANYESYGLFRAFPAAPAGHAYADARITATSTHYWSNPHDGGIAKVWAPRYDPDDVASNSYNACDSAAYYWISKNTGHQLLNIDRVADTGIDEASVGRVSVLVNGGGYGFAEREAFAPFIERYIGDDTAVDATRTFNATRGTHVYPIYVDFTPQRP